MKRTLILGGPGEHEGRKTHVYELEPEDDREAFEAMRSVFDDAFNHGLLAMSGCYFSEDDREIRCSF